MFGASHQQKKAKEPAVASAEKFMNAIQEGNMNELAQTLLDPKILFNCPMGIFFSRPHVKRWIAFEEKVMAGHKIKYHGTSSDDGMRVARNRWSIEGLHFVDTIVLNQVLMIKTVRRVMERRPNNAKEADATNALLLAWTGPYFAKYCGPKKGLNNRALVLPVLDYAYQNLKNCRELLVTRPKDGKEITDFRIALHFLTDVTDEEIDGEAPPPSTLHMQHKQEKDEVTIRAKNRDGEQAALVIDRAALGSTEEGAGKMESLEDSEVVVKEERLRFVASGLKLCNNEFTHAHDLDQAIKIFIVNAFYFLNWVDLSSNKLVSIPDLSQYPIVVLYLHDNKIASMAEVEKLQGLSQLQSLTLFENDIQSKRTKARDYKYEVLNILWEGHCKRYEGQSNLSPNDMPLKSFDHSVLTVEDKQCMERFRGIRQARSPSPPGSRLGTPSSGIRQPKPAPGEAEGKAAWQRLSERRRPGSRMRSSG